MAFSGKLVTALYYVNKDLMLLMLMHSGYTFYDDKKIAYLNSKSSTVKCVASCSVVIGLQDIFFPFYFNFIDLLGNGVLYKLSY